ncbi:IS1380 family transposase [Magnetospira thiophila]
MQFSDFGPRTVLAAFDGGKITSDAGGLLLRETATRLDLWSRMAEHFDDFRDPARVAHALPDLLAQRVMAIALGYEDVSDHDSLRFDPLLKLIATPKKTRGYAPSRLAAASTIGRLEQSFADGDQRYHKFSAKPAQLQDLYVNLFVESHDAPPERITLDIDATDIETHGHQDGGFFNGYYEHRCFLPLYITCGPHLLLSKLREGNVDGARDAKKAIRRIVGLIRKHWPAVKILVRGDSGFARNNLMNWCEANGVDYIFGLARNSYLLHKARMTRSRAAVAMIDTNAPVEMFGHFSHRPKSKSWPRPRHVIAKVLHRPGHEQRVRFLVTSLDWNSDWVIPEAKKFFNDRDAMPRAIYQNIYCPRGDMENRIKDCQLDLFGHQTSAHGFKPNQLRLILAGFAYVLLTHLRLRGLKGTDLAKAAPDTLRQKLLKIGARVITSVRRIKIAMPDAYPYKDAFFTAWRNLAPT